MSAANMDVVAGRVHDARVRLFRAHGIAGLIVEVADGCANNRNPAESHGVMAAIWQSALELAQIVDDVAGQLEPDVVLADEPDEPGDKVVELRK